MGSESIIVLRGVFRISYCKVGSLPLSSFCAFPCFLPQLSFLAVFLQPSVRAQNIGASPLSSAGAHVQSTQLVCVPRRVMWVLSSRITAHGPHPPHSAHASVPHISAHPTPPQPLLWVTCHRFVKQTGHLGREAAAVLLPGVSGICSLHIHTDTHTQAAFT